MADRVMPAAQRMAAEWYQPPSFDSDTVSMAHNRYWINEQMNRGAA